MITDEYVLMFFKHNGKYVSKRFNEKYINKTNPEIYQYLMSRFNDIDKQTTLKEIAYRIEKHLEIVPKCPVCGKRIPYKSKYGTFCSKQCQKSNIGREIWNKKIKDTMLDRYGVKYSLQSYDIKQKHKNNLIEKYGVDNVFKLDTVKQKIIDTNVQRYGYDRAQKNETVRNKIRNTFNKKYYSGTEEANRLKEIKLQKSKETMQKHYGVEYALQSNVLLEQMKQNNIRKFGVPFVMQNQEIKNKMLQTVKERYNVSSVAKLDWVAEKRKQTNIEKYGVACVFQNPIYKEKSKQTCLEKYGVEHPMQSNLIKNKMIFNNFKKYGVDNPAKTEEVKNKIQQTNLERYGVEWSGQSDLLKNKIKQTNLERYGVACTLQAETVKETTENNIIEKYGSVEKFWKYRYDQIVQSMKQNKHNGMTWIEQQTYNYLLTLFDVNDIVFNQVIDDRYPYHVDFYIKSLDLFIEINAYWTHGPHMFNPDNKEDVLLLEKWKEKAQYSNKYKKAINVWTIIDPQKIKQANNHNLNYLPIWNNDIKSIKQKINLLI